MNMLKTREVEQVDGGNTTRCRAQRTSASTLGILCAITIII